MEGKFSTLTILRTTPDRAAVFWPYLKDRVPPGTIVLNDMNRRGAMAQFLRALDMAQGSPVLLMEDDILLCRDFTQRAAQVIADKGDAPIQFFSRGRDDARLGSRWRPGSTFSMNQCHYMPAGMAQEVRQFYPAWPRLEKSKSGCDWLVADWQAEHRVRYWLHVPSLVDHRVGVSAIDPRRARDRRSTTFEGDQ